MRLKFRSRCDAAKDRRWDEGRELDWLRMPGADEVRGEGSGERVIHNK
jgi:hypothetical protein